MDRLYVLEIDLNLGESSNEPRIHALKLLSRELERRIHPKKKSFILSRVTVLLFPPKEARRSLPFDFHHDVERGKHKAARI